jgi:hypothetical protein
MENNIQDSFNNFLTELPQHFTHLMESVAVIQILIFIHFIVQ